MDKETKNILSIGFLIVFTIFMNIYNDFNTTPLTLSQISGFNTAMLMIFIIMNKQETKIT